MIIAVNGKGGTGKTTVAGLIINHIAEKRLGSLLAIDADPNSTLADLLGVKVSQSLVSVIDETQSKKDELPAGMTKDRFIQLRMQESISESEGFDLLAMGRPEGPGCYCYMNSVLRQVLDDIVKAYDYLVIDNAAGFEHISRRTERHVDRLVLVSDYSVIGVRSSVRIWELAKELGIKVGKCLLVVNKLTGPIDVLRKELDSSGIPLAGTIDYNERLTDLSVEGKPILEFAGSIENSLDGIMKKILERE